MRHLCALLFLLSFAPHLSAQQRLSIKDGCAFDTLTTYEGDYAIYPATQSALSIVKEITDEVATQQTFEVKSASVENAMACTDATSKKRFILYNESYVRDIYKNTQTKWSIYFMFAHEIGHHYNNDTFALDVNWHSKEMAADFFAGNILCGLGATTEDIEAAVKCLNTLPSRRHPDRLSRCTAVNAGWNKDCEPVHEPPPPPPQLCTEKQKICLLNVAQNAAIQVTISQKGQSKYTKVLQPLSRDCCKTLPPGLYEFTAKYTATNQVFFNSQLEVKCGADGMYEIGGE